MKREKGKGAGKPRDSSPALDHTDIFGEPSATFEQALGKICTSPGGFDSLIVSKDMHDYLISSSAYSVGTRNKVGPKYPGKTVNFTQWFRLVWPLKSKSSWLKKQKSLGIHPDLSKDRDPLLVHDCDNFGKASLSWMIHRGIVRSSSDIGCNNVSGTPAKAVPKW